MDDMTYKLPDTTDKLKLYVALLQEVPKIYQQDSPIYCEYCGIWVGGHVSQTPHALCCLIARIEQALADD